MVKPYVICSAIWINDDKEYTHQPKNITKGFVVTGRRHHNCITTVSILQSKLNIHRGTTTQGFLTSDDRFIDRKEGGQLAYAVCQILKYTNCLFSEDLY